MSEQQAEKLLAVLVLARSSSYLMSKFVLGELDTFNLLALRFLIAFAVLLVVLRKHCRQVNRKVLFHGAVIGTTFFRYYTVQCLFCTHQIIFLCWQLILDGFIVNIKHITNILH
mgnify:CR=1 FL=1